MFAATVPHLGLFLIAGADVQKDRIEVDIWAWGRGRTSWLVEHIVIPGGPEDPAAWDKLTAVLGRTWAHESGAVMQLSKLAIDTGYEAPAVYAWSRAVGYAPVTPIKGVESFNRATPVSGPTFVDATIGGKRLRRGARLWTIAVSTFKAETLNDPYLKLQPATLHGRQRLLGPDKRRMYQITIIGIRVHCKIGVSPVPIRGRRGIAAP